MKTLLRLIIMLPISYHMLSAEVTVYLLKIKFCNKEININCIIILETFKFD